MTTKKTEKSTEDTAATEAAPPTVIPVPTGVTGAWFPAFVVLPGQRMALPKKVRVYATPEGLYVYDRVPDDRDQLAVATPFWYAPIAYDKTDLPPANYSARAANGFVITTEKGVVSITVPRGCAVCGVRQVAQWEPRWSTTQLAADWKGSNS